ncbi:MAG TPA: DUF4129 domain-containing protein [Synechococcales cyanobacterium M55_K2018_004]|nr:DUF4129 domain-containing protein [Synechococcales cyanobacterium M55_K2018_004]
MSSGKFEETSFNWQLQQWQRQFGEWFERTFQGINLPRGQSEDWQLPSWVSQGLFWLLLGALAGWGLWQLYKLMRLYLTQLQWNRETPPALGVQAPEQPLTVAAWVERSRLARQQGNYRDACRALYMGALQHLNDAGLIPQQRSRTDGEYLALVQQLPQAAAYRTLIHTHERLCFSDAVISLEDCDRCQRAYQEIESP